MKEIYNYEEDLQRLFQGEIIRLEITPAEFETFQKAYMNFDKRKRIVGTAEKNGKIVYHL